MLMSSLRNSKQSAVKYILSSQCEWGEFRADCYSSIDLTGKGCNDSSPFATTIIIDALIKAGIKSDSPSVKKAIAFLNSESDNQGLFRYWSSRNWKKIDPDLDDTVCISYTLGKHGFDLDNIETILDNKNKCGLYNTWFRQNNSNNDVDIAVNANFLRYLIFLKKHTLNETDVINMDQIIVSLSDVINELVLYNREKLSSWYYVDLPSVYFMIMRAYRDGAHLLAPSADTCLNTLLDHGYLNPDSIDAYSIAITVYLVSTVLYMRCTSNQQNSEYTSKLMMLLKNSVKKLLDAQNADGSWSKRAVYAGPEPPSSHCIWWGSNELTTAFCIEGLLSFNELIQSMETIQSMPSTQLMAICPL